MDYNVINNDLYITNNDLYIVNNDGIVLNFKQLKEYFFYFFGLSC